MIQKIFKVTGLSNKFEAENELYIRFKRIKEEIIIGDVAKEKKEVVD